MSDKGHNAIKAARTTTLSQGIFNLCKSAVGAGALRLPSQLASLGLVTGLGVLGFASFLTTSTLHFLSRIAANTDVSDYFTLGSMAFGTFGEVASMLALILFLLGALIFYIFLAQNNFMSFAVFLFPSLAVWRSTLEIPLMILTGLTVFPLAVQRDMSALAKTSLVGMVCMCYVLCLTVFDYFYDSAGSAAAQIEYFASFDVATFFKVFSGMLFAFVNHFTMLSVVPVMEDPSPRRRMLMTTGSASFIALFYALISVTGYSHFGSCVPENVLDASTASAPPAIQWAYMIGKLLIGLVLVLSYPLLCDPCRSTIDGAIAKITGRPSSKSFMRSAAITVGLVSFTTLIAATCADLAGVILDAFVSFSGSLMVFIFPAAFFLKLSNKYRISIPERILAYVNIVFGLVLMVIGSYFNIKTLLTKLNLF